MYIPKSLFLHSWGCLSDGSRRLQGISRRFQNISKTPPRRSKLLRKHFTCFQDNAKNCSVNMHLHMLSFEWFGNWNLWLFNHVCSEIIVFTSLRTSPRCFSDVSSRFQWISKGPQDGAKTVQKATLFGGVFQDFWLQTWIWLVIHSEIVLSTRLKTPVKWFKTAPNHFKTFPNRLQDASKAVQGRSKHFHTLPKRC